MSYRTLLPLCGAALLLSVLSTAAAQEEGVRPAPAPTTQPAEPDDPRLQDPNYVALELKLPKPAFKGTPAHVPPGTNLEPPRKGARKMPAVPKDAKDVARGKTATSSDMEPIIGSLKCVTDGDKEAEYGDYVELGPGKQWVQIDLEHEYKLYAIVIWHYHMSPRVYHDVIVQVSSDPDFIEGVKTVFNNDHDNSSGMGIGKAKEYWDTFEGKIIPLDGVQGRYIRCYTNGSIVDDLNHYTEVEAFGVPVK